MGNLILFTSKLASCLIMAHTDDFITRLTQIAVMQIFDELDNDGMRHSSLETFAEVVQRFIQEIGSTAASFANANGRTQCNYFDIVRAFEELDVDVQELKQFENSSYPLPAPIDIDSLQSANHDAMYNEDNNEMNNDALKRQKLQQSIENNELTQNGTVLFDSQQNIKQILGKQTTNKKKTKKAKGAPNVRRKRMKHIPLYCPDYPDVALLQKNTPIWYKGTGHQEDDTQSNEHKHNKSSFEKTRKCLIKNSNLFSSISQNRNKRKLNDDKSGIGNFFSNSLPPNKRQKLSNGHSKKQSDKMENDDDEHEGNEEMEIIPNPYARK